MLWLQVVEWLARLILVVMIGLSVWSVTIMIDRRRFFKNLKLTGDELRKKIRDKKFQFDLSLRLEHLLKLRTQID